METVLETRVKGVNRCHEYANQLYPRLVEVFTPFVGQKIEKVEGGLLKKVKEKVDALKLPCTPSLNVYRNQSDYSLSYTVKTCQDNNGGAYYHEATVYVGDMSGGVLKQITALKPEFKTDYTA